MTESNRSIPLIWRVFRKVKALQIKVFKWNTPIGNVVLLLTTKGRKSGLDRVTPLQYEEQDGKLHIASARGQDADWFRNILVDPGVKVQIKGKQFAGVAEPITDPERIADFLEIRLKNHPLLVRSIMTIGGLPWNYARGDLASYAAERAMAIIHLPDNMGESTI